MTDHNVIEAVRKLAEAVRTVAVDCGSIYAADLANTAHALLAAEKPAEVAVASGGPKSGGWASDGWASEPADAEAAPVASAWCPQCGPQPTADEDGCCESCGSTATGEGADKALDAVRALPAAANPVVPVKFEGGRAGGSEWLAATHSEEPFRFVTVRLDLRPGEDAGETLAKMLAACGRTA